MTTNTNEYKSKTVAGLLALFLGGVGIHKFYLGRIGWGIAYILFCWTLIPSVVALIEAITYFSMSGKDFDYKYNGIGEGPKREVVWFFKQFFCFFKCIPSFKNNFSILINKHILASCISLNHLQATFFSPPGSSPR